MMQHATLVNSLYQIGAIQLGEFVLKSGQTSNLYINLRKIISYPQLLKSISQTMWEAVRNRSFDVICGVPYTALPIAVCMSLDHNFPMIMRRKEKKEYGTKQLIEGIYQPGQTCLIIEDIITTGSSIIETAADLEAAGLKINDVVVLIDREQGGCNNLMDRYRIHPLITLSQILTHLLQSDFITPTERHYLDEFMKARTLS